MNFSSYRLFSHQFIDRIGGCLSTACAIHCSLKPLLLLLPSVAWLDFLMDHSTERILLGSGIFLALGSTFWGFSKHRQTAIFLPLAIAFGLIIVGRYAMSGTVRTMLVVPGGLTVATTHYLNMKLRENCGEEVRCRDLR